MRMILCVLLFNLIFPQLSGTTLWLVRVCTRTHTHTLLRTCINTICMRWRFTVNQQRVVIVIALWCAVTVTQGEGEGVTHCGQPTLPDSWSPAQLAKVSANNKTTAVCSINSSGSKWPFTMDSREEIIQCYRLAKNLSTAIFTFDCNAVVDWELNVTRGKNSTAKVKHCV